MACGRSVLEAQLTATAAPTTGGTSVTTIQSRTYFRGEAQDAIRFLQAEHERILNGLHKQMQILQQRCDDLQFEAHMRHITETSEEKWKTQTKELTSHLKEKDDKIQDLERRLEEKTKCLDEEREQHKWKELQMRQRLLSEEQKVEELKAKHALNDSMTSPILKRGGSVNFPPSRNSVFARASSFEVLDVTKLKKTIQDSKRERLKSARSLKPQLEDASEHSLLSASLCLPFSSLLRGPSPRTTRPSSSTVTLPPISQSQSVTRPTRSRHRMTSAPTTEANNKK